MSVVVTRRWYFGGTLTMTDRETWSSFARCATDSDPFQSGAHTTMPAWYVVTHLEYLGYRAES